MTKKTMNFKHSFERLKEIEQILENEEIVDIDKLLVLQKEANELFKFCESKLKEAENLKNN